ncbi:MAG: serine hydrolase domain-containing protein [Terriglobales bacterium]
MTRSALAALVLSLAAPLAAQSQSARLEAIFRAVTRPDAPGLAVVVRQHGRTVFLRGYGQRDRRSALPVTPRTDFRLASFSKQFTAMAVMLLVRDGKLRYDEPLTEVFPGFPAYGARITIRELLNHTSGLIAYEDLMAKQYAGRDPTEIPQIHDAGVLKLAEEQSGTLFPPGTRWEYSNGGYCLLAMAVARASGMSFPAFMRRRIFAPLHMSRTLEYVYGGPPVPERAYGYVNDAGVWLEADQDPTSATLGDGGIYSSVEDLARWDEALRDHTLLSAQAMQPALTPVMKPITGSGYGTERGNAQPALYGFGWFLDPYQGHRRMWHSGETTGFRTAIERFPQDDVTVIVLANRTDLDIPTLALKAASLLLPNPR